MIHHYAEMLGANTKKLAHYQKSGTKKSDCAARNHSVSDLLDLSGSMGPYLGNTPTTQKHNSAFVCSTAEKQCIKSAVTFRKLEMAQCQSCTTSNIFIACKENTCIEYEHIACDVPLCSSFENRGKKFVYHQKSSKRVHQIVL